MKEKVKDIEDVDKNGFIIGVDGCLGGVKRVG